MNYVTGIPGDFDRTFDGYDFSLSSNMTLERLRDSLVGYIGSGHTWPQSNDPMTSEFYCFFQRSSLSCDVSLAHRFDLRVALNPENYGIDELVIDINPQRVDIELSKRQTAEYEMILSLDRINLADLLQTVGYVVNSSMAYDFEKTIQLGRELGLDTRKYERLAMFTPNSNGSLKGICTDAGKLIRQILENMGMEQRVLFTSVKTLEEGYSHDTTLVFDFESGRWTVVNSKSPTKLYALTPKNKIEMRKNGYILKNEIIIPTQTSE